MASSGDTNRLTPSCALADNAVVTRPKDNRGSPDGQHPPQLNWFSNHLTVTSAEVAFLTYSRRVERELPTPLLPLPDVQQSRRRILPTNFTPRHSLRIAASSQQRVPAAQHTQLMLAATLGVASDSDSVTVANLQQFFDKPLSNEQSHPLQLSFGSLSLQFCLVSQTLSHPLRRRVTRHRHVRLHHH